MKILIATGIYPPEIGGPATYAKLLHDELPKRGIAVEVLPFRGARRYPRVLRHLVYCYRVWLALRHCDLVFTQDPVSTGVAVVVASWLRGKPMVLRVAGDYAWEQAQQRFGVIDNIDDFQSRHYGWRVGLLRALQRFSVRHANVVVTPSHYFNRLVSTWNNHLRPVTTIYNGIDLTQSFRRGQKHAISTMISAGRLVPWKRFDDLIKLMSHLPGWQLQIAGDGPDRERLEKLIETERLQGRVRLLGSLSRPELFAAIHQAEVFVLWSTFESFSFQLVEAMHVGTPVIVADIGNLSEIVTSGQDGFLVPVKDEAKLVETILKIKNDSDLGQQLSTRAQARAQDFSIQKTFDQLVTVFKKLV